MVRIKRGNVARKRRAKILNLAQGFQGAHSRLFRVANGQVMKALVYSYVGRKHKKRKFRQLWICRINAMSRLQGSKYSVLLHGLKKASIYINLKMLAHLLLFDAQGFSKVISSADEA